MNDDVRRRVLCGGRGSCRAVLSDGDVRRMDRGTEARGRETGGQARTDTMRAGKTCSTELLR